MNKEIAKKKVIKSLNNSDSFMVATDEGFFLVGEPGDMFWFSVNMVAKIKNQIPKESRNLFDGSIKTALENFDLPEGKLMAKVVEISATEFIKSLEDMENGK